MFNFSVKEVRRLLLRMLINGFMNGQMKRLRRCFLGEIGKLMRISLSDDDINHRLWGGKMSEEQATEEGRYITIFKLPSEDRLEFIKAKYFGRNFGMSELAWYVAVERPLHASTRFGRFVFESDDCDKVDMDYSQREEMGSPNSTQPGKNKRASAKRLSVSSSESDVDINDVLKEVVKDYEATHGRSGRESENVYLRWDNLEARDSEDLISLE